MEVEQQVSHAGSWRVMNKRNEANEFTEGNDVAAVEDSDELKLLRVVGAYRHDHASAFAQLGNERSGEIGSGGRNEDCVEGSEGGDAKGAVSRNGFYVGVGVAEPCENLTGARGEGVVALNGVHLHRELSQQGGCVAGASANFENFFVGLKLEGLEHERNDVGLRDGLSIADGERMIFVGLGAVLGGNEFVARNAEHGVENTWVRDSAGSKLVVNHQAAGCGEVGHGDGVSKSF